MDFNGSGTSMGGRGRTKTYVFQKQNVQDAKQTIHKLKQTYLKRHHWAHHLLLHVKKAM